MTLRLVSDGAPAPEMTAAAWAVRLDRGDLDAAESAAFELWLDRPGNAEAYADAAAALCLFDGFDSDLPELAMLRSEALADAGSRAAPVAPARSSRRWMPWAGGALAASIAAALIFAGQPGVRDGMPDEVSRVAASDRSGVETAANESPVYRTAVGEQRTITLADGSRVTLNTATEIRVDYRARARLVRLVRGQALFDVAHAPDRPFSVVAGGRKVTALGTVFEVRFDNDRLKVTLMRGKVRVDDDDGNPANSTAVPALAVLAPGQQLVVTGALAPVVESVDVDKQLLWRRSLVEFDGDTVADAVAELNRYSPTQIVVADSRVASMRMSGIVRTGDAAEFTELVGAMLPVAARKNPQGELELYYAP